MAKKGTTLVEIFAEEEQGKTMTTIRNINEKFGDGIEFSGHTLDDAIEIMQAAIRECGPELANATVTDADYVIVER